MSPISLPDASSASGALPRDTSGTPQADDDMPPIRIAYLTAAEIDSVRVATNTPCWCPRCRASKSPSPNPETAL